MTLLRSASMRSTLPQLRAALRSQRSTVATARQRFTAGSRRGYASATDSAQAAAQSLGSEMPWLLGAVAVTVPATYLILSKGPLSGSEKEPGDEWHGPSEGEEQEEGGEEGGEESGGDDQDGEGKDEGGDDEEKAEAKSDDEEKGESGDDQKEDSGDDKKEEGEQKEGSDDSKSEQQEEKPKGGDDKKKESSGDEKKKGSK